MSTLRKVLADVSAGIDRKVSGAAVDRLKDQSEKAYLRVNGMYEGFFKMVSKDIIGGTFGSDVDGDTGGVPYVFQERGAKAAPWKPLHEKWMYDKAKYATSTKGASLTIYHGITGALSDPVKINKKNRMRPKKVVKGKSLSSFVKDFSGNKRNTQKMFGKLKMEYKIVRPDGGETKVKTVGNMVKEIQQWAPKEVRKKKVLTGSIAGTRLIATISAFGDLQLGWDETKIVNHMINKDKRNWRQWSKINAKRLGGHWRIRPVILPLINWYVNVAFKAALREEFK